MYEGDNNSNSEINNERLDEARRLLHNTDLLGARMISIATDPQYENSQDRAIAWAKLQSVVAGALSAISETHTRGDNIDWDGIYHDSSGIVNQLFDPENPKSLQSNLLVAKKRLADRLPERDGQNPLNAEAIFSGAVNTLTFVNLFNAYVRDKGLDPEKYRVKIASPKLDVMGATDVKIYTPEGEIYVQLKSGYSSEDIRGTEITEAKNDNGTHFKNVPGAFRRIGEKEVEKITAQVESRRQKAKTQTDDYSKEFRAAAFIVPGMRDPRVGNVFGIINPDYEKSVSEQFQIALENIGVRAIAPSYASVA